MYRKSHTEKTIFSSSMIWYGIGQPRRLYDRSMMRRRRRRSCQVPVSERPAAGVSQPSHARALGCFWACWILLCSRKELEHTLIFFPVCSMLVQTSISAKEFCALLLDTTKPGRVMSSSLTVLHDAFYQYISPIGSVRVRRESSTYNSSVWMVFAHC